MNVIVGAALSAPRDSPGRTMQGGDARASVPVAYDIAVTEPTGLAGTAESKTGRAGIASEEAGYSLPLLKGLLKKPCGAILFERTFLKFTPPLRGSRRGKGEARKRVGGGSFCLSSVYSLKTIPPPNRPSPKGSASSSGFPLGKPDPQGGSESSLSPVGKMH